jgi:hypothetical protein
MIRSLAAILHALSIVAPNFFQQHAAAGLLRELGARHGFDPLTLVAIVDHESHWYASAISKNGRDYGLAQIEATNYATCRAPVLVEECDSRKRWLLEWDNNLNEAAALIEANREFCKAKIGSTLAVYWLQQFQGFGATRHTTCGHVRRHGKWVAVEVPAMTREVLARRMELASAWAEEIGISSRTLMSRLMRGWTPEQAVSRALGHSRSDGQ